MFYRKLGLLLVGQMAQAAEMIADRLLKARKATRLPEECESLMVRCVNAAESAFFERPSLHNIGRTYGAIRILYLMAEIDNRLFGFIEFKSNTKPEV